MHDVGAVIENLHIGFQDVEMEGRCQHASVAVPLVTSTHHLLMRQLKKCVRTVITRLLWSQKIPVFYSIYYALLNVYKCMRTYHDVVGTTVR